MKNCQEAPNRPPELYAREGAANTGTNKAADLLSSVNRLQSTSIGVERPKISSKTSTLRLAGHVRSTTACIPKKAPPVNVTSSPGSGQVSTSSDSSMPNQGRSS